MSRAPAWSADEDVLLANLYPREGAASAIAQLPGRSLHAIQVRANRLGLSCAIVQAAPTPVLHGERLERAIRLREVDGWSFKRIGDEMGVSETSACNAVLIALCPRKGFTPAQRDELGRLLPEGVERLRYMLRKGLKAIEIQTRLGLSAARVAEERRRYDADLRARGKATLPPPGGGEAYSGVRLPRAKKQAVEQLLLEGFGAQKVRARTGVSVTSVGRIRNRLIARLARKGQTLPGCDSNGVRIGAPKESVHFIPDEAVHRLRRLLLDRMPVARAAKLVGIGGSAAYRHRDALAAELAEQGRALLPPRRSGAHERAPARAAAWLPAGKRQRYRVLTIEHGLDEAKRILLREIDTERAAAVEAARAERARPKTFEEQLAIVASGRAGIVPVFRAQRAAPDRTLGGVATGAI